VRGLALRVHDMAVRTPPSRERSADMWRALAIFLVVFGHWFVSGVTYEDGERSWYNALDTLTWIDPVTWLFQVMPIFFLVGGYASGASLASHRASGGASIGWVQKRTDRLLRPTTALFVVVPAVTAVLVAAGVDRELLGAAAWAASVPLWFLVAYLALVVLTPWLYALHRRAGLAVPIVMVALVGVADLARMGLDAPTVGRSGYLFAWTAVYQLGFCWRDGLLRLSRRQSLALVAGGLIALIALTVPGPYALPMVGYNTNPPTLALMVLAITQVGVVLALQSAANQWLRRIRPWTVLVASNAVILTVFLWHMTAAVLAAVLLIETGVMPKPPVDSETWLLWRVPWIVVCAVIQTILVALFAGIELRRPELHLERRLWRDIGTVLGLAAVLAGLYAVSASGPGYHGPTGLPWAAVISYLAGAAVLRVVRSKPVRRAAPGMNRQVSGP